MLPCLFHIFLHTAVREHKPAFREECQVQVLLLADDTVLVTEAEDGFKHNIKAL